ncbi:DUF664 domain-containing protein [Kribbella pittospori]|uniref:DUF664 domain-containing protein n=1 Tax=Kribbella pittospori TaxID=722689 RepID=A0A4R0KAG9_9ACTN|nr:DinB family protein [Kribbella pittospori]TCC56560.1 DUF664 domain-containing protein [Kribbella pittospori]
MENSIEQVDLRGAVVRDVDLRGARFERVKLRGAVMRGMNLEQVRIDGAIEGLVINGVEVEAYVSDELDRRYPDRVKMRPTDVPGFREAWDVVEQLWDGTVARARKLPPELLHESVDGEWSFIQTLRHLAFATDAWICRVIQGEPSPWNPLDLPFDEMADTPGVPRDRDVRPSLEEVLELRQNRMAVVRRYVDNLTEDALNADTTPVAGPGWPPPDNYPVREILLLLLNEEWQHRLYAERDLAVLESPST